MNVIVERAREPGFGMLTRRTGLGRYVFETSSSRSPASHAALPDKSTEGPGRSHDTRGKRLLAPLASRHRSTCSRYSAAVSPCWVWFASSGAIAHDQRPCRDQSADKIQYRALLARYTLMPATVLMDVASAPRVVLPAPRPSLPEALAKPASSNTRQRRGFKIGRRWTEAFSLLELDGANTFWISIA
jgi:hypothetical protein